MGVLFNHHHLIHPHRPPLCHPPQVIARQIHQHHVFRHFLRIPKQFLRQPFILRRRMPPGARPGNRSQSRQPPLRFHHHLRARADQLPIPKLEKRHVGRRIHQAQRTVEQKGVA